MVVTLDRSSHKVAHALRIEIDNLAYALQRQQTVKDVEQRLLEINRKLGGVKSDPQYKELREHFLALTAAAGIFLTVATTSHYQVNPQIFQPTSIELRADTSAGIRLTSTTQILNEVQADFGTTSSQLSITALMHAIIGQESNGKFNITNPHSGALGYGQVMPENVTPWSLEALGYALTPKEFLNSPKLQLKIIKFKLGQAIASQTQPDRSEEEVIRRAAAIWYSGQARLWNSNRPEYYNGHPYPSIAEYTQSVWEKYQAELSPASSELSDWTADDKSTPAKGEKIAGYEVTSPWGNRKGANLPVGASTFHKGTDVGMPEGTPLYVIGSAQNFNCSWDAKAGNIASFDSPELGKSFDYYHLSKCDRTTREMRVGNTGIDGGAHLHINQRNPQTLEKEPPWRGFIRWAIRGKK
jgi:hypothetical protein